jgi:hypothetical protein
MIIQNKNKKKYLEEKIKYGNPPNLEDLQCLNLFIDVIQPYLSEKLEKEISKKEVSKWNIKRWMTAMSDSELRNKTIRDSGLILKVANEFDINIPWSWIKIYLPRYKKSRKKIFKEIIQLQSWIKDYLLNKFNSE